jgi:tRNA (cmo5U34)-methyltransferase
VSVSPEDRPRHFPWDPESYLEVIHAEVPQYDRLQAELTAATLHSDVRAILELGTGSGETASRLLAAHPHARLRGIDVSARMLAAAGERLDPSRVLLSVGRIQDPLPAGPYDLIASALAVHHLDAAEKRALFARVYTVMRPGGRFVLADVVVPLPPRPPLATLNADYDRPSSVADQFAWLAASGLEPSIAWETDHLAVLVATRPAAAVG